MPDSSTKPLSITDLREKKANGEKITMLTAYDVLIARLLDGAVDTLLVGDSVNQVIAGHPTTLNATLDQMIYHGAAVRRGVSHSLVFVDMPFLSYQISVQEAIRNAGRVMAETNAHGVKLEGGEYMAETIHALVQVGIPVVGHLGLTPQSIHQLGGPKVQGRKKEVADRLRSDIKAVEQAGAAAIVLELVPASLATELSKSISVPTIGIGAGPGCDGQVLVLQDMLGLNEGFSPKFLKTYADLAGTIRAAARMFSDDVRGGRYPTADHSFD